MSVPNTRLSHGLVNLGIFLYKVLHNLVAKVLFKLVQKFIFRARNPVQICELKFSLISTGFNAFKTVKSLKWVLECFLKAVFLSFV